MFIKVVFSQFLFFRDSVIRFFFLFIASSIFSGITLAQEQINTSSKNSEIIMGYYPQWGIYSPNIHIHDLPLDLMTHFVYMNAGVNEKGEVYVGDPYADIEHFYPNSNLEKEAILGSIGELLKLKEKLPGLTTIISIGGWSRSHNFSQVASTKQGRQKLAKSAVAFMKKYKFDGVELDWQFPVEPNHETKPGVVTYNESDATNLKLLVKEIRKELNKEPENYWFQMTISARALTVHWKAENLDEDLDLIVLDVSQLAGNNELEVYHLTPLYGDRPRRSLNSVILELEKRGLSKNKLVPGVAAFALGWQGGLQNKKVAGQIADEVSWGSWDSKQSRRSGLYAYNTLEYIRKQGSYEELWDPQAHMSYLFSAERFGGHFVTFEDKHSISEKVAYIQDNELAGIAVRQLNNGNEILIESYLNFHLIKGLVYQTKMFWQKNQHLLISIIQLLVILLIMSMSSFIFFSKKNSLIAQERKEFHKLQKDLIDLEWPLLNLLSLSPVLYQKRIIEEGSTKRLLTASSQIVTTISKILSQTRLGRTFIKHVNEPIELQNLMETTDSFLSIQRNQRIRWDNEINCQLYTDRNQLQQLMQSICLFLINEPGCLGDISVDITLRRSYAELTLSAENNDKKNKLNHSQLKPLFALANLLDVRLSLVGSNNEQIMLLVPTTKDQDVMVPKKVTFIEQSDPIENLIGEGSSESNKFKEFSSTNQSLDSEVESISSCSAAEENDEFLLSKLASFNLTEIAGKDIYKGLEHACQFFAEYINQDSKISIYQSEQLVTKLGKDIGASGHESIFKADEFHIEVISSRVLSIDERQLLKVLISQIQLIQKALKSLVSEPYSLAELHEITQQKDKILYLKAETGYTGIYTQSRKDPRYIAMRLRTIKLYFDDSALLQIHRSFLVNPKKVNSVTHVSKLKFVMNIGKESIPISRTYIPLLKGLHPDWFDNSK